MALILSNIYYKVNQILTFTILSGVSGSNTSDHVSLNTI